ncbi:septal ring lytic transglycosylase RlpA family protein [Polyangium aurulentum]|uniref:septal ring lytic transglycosylase RlpA family protein n=1 Tax=Polyangium aurulentum TaxID=2567896 RepID=UPI001980D3A0|nr:septal ring lytic transglycosylase RlpA family protein [Polyangium aurulentum]UQA56469.1 septal ring lytic transglycosylase RlpA family protein [Polyangium aurulentum]
MRGAWVGRRLFVLFACGAMASGCGGAAEAGRGASSAADAAQETSPEAAPAPAPGAKNAAPDPTANNVPPGPGIRAEQRGGASFYADKFTGRKTASGELYDPGLLTAAHLTLPFNSVVEVIRKNGRRVTVRINDRGPHIRGRIIDLSRSAAEAIGLDGVADVIVRVISVPPPKPKKKKAKRRR